MTQLSEKTKQVYEQRLNFLRENFKSPDTKWMSNSSAVINYIESLDKSVNTKKLFYITLKSVLRDMPRKTKGLKDAEKAYETKMQSYNKKVNETMEEQLKNKRESEVWIQWPDVLAARNKAISEASTVEELQDALILALYTYLPPARLDYAPMHIITEENVSEEPEGNLLVVGKKKMYFIFKEYKTAHRYGRKVVEIPKPLQKLISEWLEINQSNVLLLNMNGQPMSEALLGARIRRILHQFTGKGASVNILRHSFISHVRKGEKSFKKQKEIADAMFHSVEMSVMYRRIDD